MLILNVLAAEGGVSGISRVVSCPLRILTRLRISASSEAAAAALLVLLLVEGRAEDGVRRRSSLLIGPGAWAWAWAWACEGEGEGEECERLRPSKW